MHDLSRSINSFASVSSMSPVFDKKAMASLIVHKNTRSFSEEEIGQYRRRCLITACDKAASFVMNVRQMQVRDAAKRARLQLKGGG
jgi:hypothetical protein